MFALISPRSGSQSAMLLRWALQGHHGPLVLLLQCFMEISVFNANSADPDLMPNSAASVLGLHCLPMSLLWDTRHKWVNGKQCRFWSDVAFCSIWSRSTVIAIVSFMDINGSTCHSSNLITIIMKSFDIALSIFKWMLIWVTHIWTIVCGSPVLCTFFHQKLTTALLESAEGREWP